MGGESPVQAKLLAGLGLVCITTTVGLLYKVSQSASGGFSYSTTSAITMAELVKLVMSCLLHVRDPAHRSVGSSAVLTAWRTARAQLSRRALLHIWTLSVLYTFNNQVSFFVYTLADPGTIYLFKSATTVITAGVQCAFAGKTFSGLQWQAMALQAAGMVIVQYDPCLNRAIYGANAYMCMGVTVLVTSVTSARNEYLVKNYAIALNVQNAALYAGGFLMNLTAFLLLPNPNSSEASIGFFDGYGNPLAVAVVVVNAMIGLAITAVYKYADAVVKCIATNITSVFLIIISAIFFGVKMSLIMWAGVFVTCFGVNLYIDASRQVVPKVVARAPEPKQEPSPFAVGRREPNDSDGDDKEASTLLDAEA